MFLVGKGIPERITSLPQTVLNTPFGQMLRPQLDSAMRSMTQAPLPLSSAPAAQAVRSPQARVTNGHYTEALSKRQGVVHNITSLRELDPLLSSAVKKCAIIFFTSATCPPCKLVYPAFDELAAEAGNRAVFIKVDISHAYDIASKYGVRATPTFLTFLRGEKENEWSGANESSLRGNVGLLLQMAQHPHISLRLPILLETSSRMLTYERVPPLDKLTAKLGDAAHDPSIISAKNFVATRSKEGAIEATLPDLKALGLFVQRSTRELSGEALFPIVDLLRAAMADPRCSGYYAEEKQHTTVMTIVDYVNQQSSAGQRPYHLRLVTLQMLCNLFNSPLFSTQALTDPLVASPIIQLLSANLLDDLHENVRVAAASLAFNTATVNHTRRVDDDEEILPEGEQLQLLASLLEAISMEKASVEAVKRELLALGLLIHCVPKESELLDFVKAADAARVVKDKANMFPKEKLVKEIGEELLGKGVV